MNSKGQMLPFNKHFLEEVKTKMEKKIFTQCETKLVSVCTEDVITTSAGVGNNAFPGETDILGGGNAVENPNG